MRSVLAAALLTVASAALAQDAPAPEFELVGGSVKGNMTIAGPGEWRRAAHKCADAVYARLSGEGPFFDSRVVYVAETGPKNNRMKRIAIMDADGSNHRYLTEGKATALTPRFSPDGRQLVYTSYLGRMPRVFVIDIASGNERMLVPGRIMTFAPRFSPDGRTIVFSMAQNGNTDLYAV